MLTPAKSTGSQVTKSTATVHIIRRVNKASNFIIVAHFILKCLMIQPPNIVPPAPPGITSIPIDMHGENDLQVFSVLSSHIVVFYCYEVKVKGQGQYSMPR